MSAEGLVARIQKVAVIGAGRAGRRFALRCAQAGFDVVLEDVMPANLRHAEMELADLDAHEVRGTVEFALTVEEAAYAADLAVDFVPDELESKLEIFSLMDRMAPPRTIFCTPSEALSITDLASCTYRESRCIALRGELGSGSDVRILYPALASKEVLARTEEFFTALRFTVVVESDPEAPTLVKNLKLAD